MVFHAVPDGVEFRVKVAAGASRNRLVGQYGGMLKVSVSAPREKGKANQALVRLLAQKLNSAHSSVRVIAGQTSTIKTVFAAGISPQQCESCLLEGL